LAWYSNLDNILTKELAKLNECMSSN
jgi:hypothetical protein